LKVTAASGAFTFNNIGFGDNYVCGGQSNMHGALFCVCRTSIERVVKEWFDKACVNSSERTHCRSPPPPPHFVVRGWGTHRFVPEIM
jgi:hypothetical protein